MATTPAQVSTFLDWFRTTKFAQYYKDEIAGVENIHALMDRITERTPAAREVCQEIKNEYNQGFYNELKEDHKNWVDKNSPSLERKIIQED